MQLDYKELQTVADVRQLLERERRRSEQRHVVWAVLPVMLVSVSGTIRIQSHLYYPVLLIGLAVWLMLFSFAELSHRRRVARQMKILLGVAERAIDSDPANRQTLNELNILKTSR